MIYDNDTRKITRLESALAEARERIADLEVRYQADCQSCVHDSDSSNKRPCYSCSVKAKSRYTPIGMALEGATSDEVKQNGKEIGSGNKRRTGRYRKDKQMNYIKKFIKDEPVLFACIIVGLPLIVIAMPLFAALYVCVRFFEYVEKSY